MFKFLFGKRDQSLSKGAVVQMTPRVTLAPDANQRVRDRVQAGLRMAARAERNDEVWAKAQDGRYAGERWDD